MNLPPGVRVWRSKGEFMTPWITLALAALLGLTSAGFNPTLVHTPWAAFDSAFRVGHPLFLGTLALILMLAAVPLELRAGRLALLAAWGLPCLAQFWLFGRAWAELAGVALLVTLLVVAYRRKEPLPWKVWVPLWLVTALTCWVLSPPPLALAVSVMVGAALGWWAKSEAVAILGLASGGALLLAWLS